MIAFDAVVTAAAGTGFEPTTLVIEVATTLEDDLDAPNEKEIGGAVSADVVTVSDAPENVKYKK